MVTLLPRDVLAGSFEECTEQSGEVELLALDDTFSGSEFNSDRWRTGHVALFGTSTIDPDPYLGGEIRQNDGLHLVFPKGFTNRTHKRDHPLEDNFATHFGKYRLFAEHRKPLVGDFDVQVDFSYAAEKYPSSSGIELYASLNPMSEDGYNDIAGVRRVQYWYQANAGTGGHTTTDNDGKFRLVRSGSDITAYHWDSGTSSWQTYTSWTYTGYGDPVWVGLSVFTNQHSVISGSFSNFIFNDGGDTRSDAGSYISPIYDSGRTVTWGNLAWEESLPSGTDIELQVAFSDDEEGPWNFVGPDGTSGTKFTTSTGQSVYGSPSSRYCRYKAYLTGDGTDTPTLGTVELGFSGNLDSQIRTFAFDDAGNMTEKITKSDSSLIEETRTYNDLNQITQNQIDDGTTVTTWTFTHDSNGNMTSKSDGTDTYTYVWNEDNQLESVELNSSPVVDYVYDSGSRMLQRSEGSTTTNFHWDGWDLVREEKDDGVDVEVTNYLVPHGEVLAFERDDEWFYLHNDGISSTQLVTDESGAQVGRMVYGAWGETLSSSESVPGVLDVRFVGGLGVRNDAATGLIWMRHRWYDPTLNRFISRDPIGLAGGSNLYKYSANNPATFIDSQGLWTLHPMAATFGKNLVYGAIGTVLTVGGLSLLAGAGAIGAALATGIVITAGIAGAAILGAHVISRVVTGKGYTADEIAAFSGNVVGGGIASRMLSPFISRLAGTLGRHWNPPDECPTSSTLNVNRSQANSTEPFVPEAHYESLAGHAPVQSAPYDLRLRYHLDGTIRQATGYDAFGNRIRQYDIGGYQRNGQEVHPFYYNKNYPRPYGKRGHPGTPLDGLDSAANDFPPPPVPPTR